MLEVVIGSEKWVLVAPVPDSVQVHSGSPLQAFSPLNFSSITQGRNQCSFIGCKSVPPAKSGFELGSSNQPAWPPSRTSHSCVSISGFAHLCLSSAPQLQKSGIENLSSLSGASEKFALCFLVLAARFSAFYPKPSRCEKQGWFLAHCRWAAA